MKARWPIILAALAGLAATGAPAFAQDAPAQNAVVGPPQLSNFSLNGTVTHATTAPAQVQPRPRTASPGTTAVQPPRTPTSTRSAQTGAPTVKAPARAAHPDAEVQLPTADSAALPPAQVTESSPAPAPAVVSDPPLDTPSNGMPMLPWLAAALVLAGGAAWYFLRRRPHESLAGVGELNLFEAPAAPAPAPAPAPRPAPPVTEPESGIVSTRLRPWVEIEIEPLRAIVDEQKVAIEFNLSVVNSGKAPAFAVLVEAALFNAGALQDQQITAFFDRPLGQGDRIEMIAPQQRVSVRTAVFLPHDQLRPVEIEGRPFFVPLIAFNALYGWGNSQGQTSASYLVGKTTKTDKLAPFRLDLGPRMFRSLAAREHELKLRK